MTDETPADPATPSSALMNSADLPEGLPDCPRCLALTSLLAEYEEVMEGNAVSLRDTLQHIRDFAEAALDDALVPATEEEPPPEEPPPEAA